MAQPAGSISPEMLPVIAWIVARERRFPTLDIHGYVYLAPAPNVCSSESDAMLSFVTLIGRPPGSTDGVTPVGGFPDVNAEFGAFLAGSSKAKAALGSLGSAEGRSGVRCSC